MNCSIDVSNIATRMTVVDTVDNQTKMKQYLEDKIKYPIMLPEEHEFFRKLMTYSMISQGSTLETMVKLWLPHRMKLVTLGCSLFHYGEQLCIIMNPSRLRQKDGIYFYHVADKFDTSVNEWVTATRLWMLFRDNYNRITGRAIAEAFTRSKEMMRRFDANEMDESEMRG